MCKIADHLPSTCNPSIGYPLVCRKIIQIIIKKITSIYHLRTCKYIDLICGEIQHVLKSLSVSCSGSSSIQLKHGESQFCREKLMKTTCHMMAYIKK